MERGDVNAPVPTMGERVNGVEAETETSRCWPPANFMRSPGKLPRFSYRGFAEDLAKWTREEEERKRRQHEDKRNMWTATWQRSLAEPPIMDWSYIFNEKMASDVQYAALFPNDPERRCAQKDFEGELEALYQYSQWTQIMQEDVEGSEARGEFYQQLQMDIDQEYNVVEEEASSNWSWASDTGIWEQRHLDTNGGTEGIQSSLGKGANVFRLGGEEVKSKYGHLIPIDFKYNELATFEFEHLDKDGGHDRLRRMFSRGDDVFKGCSAEVKEKYSYLCTPDWELRVFENRWIYPHGDSRRVADALARGQDVFRWYGRLVREKYGAVFQPNYKWQTLTKFEYQWGAFLGDTHKIEAALVRGDPIFRGWPLQVAQKYAHLAPPDYKMRCFRRWLLENGHDARRWIEQHTSKGIDPLLFEVKLRESYVSFYPKDFVMNKLASFEYYALTQDGGTSKIEEKLRHGLEAFKGWGDEVEGKYGYLRDIVSKPIQKRLRMARQAESGESSGTLNSKDSSDTAGD